jgi:hypothetical protein
MGPYTGAGTIFGATARHGGPSAHAYALITRHRAGRCKLHASPPASRASKSHRQIGTKNSASP